MNFDNCIYPCNHHWKQDIRTFHHPRKFLSALSQSVPLLLSKVTTVLSHILFLPFLELRIDVINQYELFCVWHFSLNIMFLRFMHVVTLYQKFISFYFSIKLLEFVHQPVDEYLGCFLFSTIRTKAAINIFPKLLKFMFKFPFFMLNLWEQRKFFIVTATNSFLVPSLCFDFL